MAGYLLQVATQASSYGRLFGSQLRPVVRSSSPIAQFDQRLGLSGWEGAAGPLADELHLGSAEQQGSEESPITLEGQGQGIAHPSPPSTGSRLAVPAPSHRSPLDSALVTPVSPTTGTKEVPRARTSPSEPLVAGQGQPSLRVEEFRSQTRAIPGSTPAVGPASDPLSPGLNATPRHSTRRTAGRRTEKQPSSVDSASAMEQEAVVEVAGSATDSSAGPPQGDRDHAKSPALGVHLQPDRSRPPHAQPGNEETRTARSRPTARPDSGGLPSLESGIAATTRPQVVIDRLEIEVVAAPSVPAPMVSAPPIRPNAAGQAAKQAESRIGPLSDPLAAARRLGLRYS